MAPDAAIAKAMPESGMAEALLEAMTEAVYVVDRKRTIRYWNRAAEELTGYRAADVVGRHCRDGILNHVDDEGRLLCHGACPLLGTMRHGTVSRAYVYLHHRDGHRVPVAVSAAALRDADGKVVGAVEVFHDETRTRLLAEQLSAAEAAATIDPLTGIGNRRMLTHALQRHASDFDREGQRYAVLFIDIDHFKQVNDRFGHDAGDRALQLVAHTAQRLVRPSDTVGRWGGEEFLVIAPAADHDAALALAERIRVVTSTAWVDTQDGPLSVTLSVGVSLVTSGDSPSTVMARADAALYQAKADGRNRTVFA